MWRHKKRSSAKLDALESLMVAVAGTANQSGGVTRRSDEGMLLNEASR